MQLADYAMIANSVPQDVKIKSVNEKKMEEQDLATSALGNKAKEMQNQQTQSQLDYKNVLKGALQKNTKYNADGTSTTDHRAVANAVGQAGYIDEAHDYTLNQQKEIYATHKDQLQFISSLAQGVLRQPEAVREQAYQLAIAQAKNSGFDTSGAKPNYDENYLTGIINTNITAKDFFDAPNKKMAAEANLLRAGAAEQNANSLSTRREALNNKLEIGSTQQPIASQGTLERIADMADAGMSLKDSPYAGLFTGSQNVANRNALAETITARATANGRDVADSLIALQDFRSGNKAAVVLAGQFHHALLGSHRCFHFATLEQGTSVNVQQIRMLLAVQSDRGLDPVQCIGHTLAARLLRFHQEPGRCRESPHQRVVALGLRLSSHDLLDQRPKLTDLSGLAGGLHPFP